MHRGFQGLFARLLLTAVPTCINGEELFTLDAAGYNSHLPCQNKRKLSQGVN